MTAEVVQAEVQTLVDLVRASASRQDADGLRLAYQRILEQLDVAPDRMSAWRDGLDIVGSAYQRLLTGQQRRAAGQFFTPFWAGEVMATPLNAQHYVGFRGSPLFSVK